MSATLLIAALVLVPGEKWKAGKVSTIQTKNKLHYALRVPKKRNKKTGNPAIVFLHGSNMRGENYARSLETSKALEDWVIIAPTGPKKVKDKQYNHNPGDERYVAKVIEDVVDRLGIELSRIYVGGHSQGGFLSHAVAAHLPKKIDGVLACSSGSWAGTRKLQRKGKGRARQLIPIALVHAQDDPVVSVRASVAVYDGYLKSKHTDVRLFIPRQGAHMFMRLPILDAIKWLDLMNETKRSKALKVLSKVKADKDPRTAWDAAHVVKRLSKGKKHAKADAVIAKIKKIAKKLARELEKRIKKAELDPELRAVAYDFLGNYGMVESKGAWRKAFDKAARK